ncbi:MAG: InlB B-repeat-containing protein, partial [Bacilli bacterium]|nr:InlB B-repeat-containing protein [Bacilli bacterium]
MINNEKQNSFNNEKKEKKKRFLLILFLIIFLVPIGFGIYALIPDRPAPVVTYEVKLINNDDGGLSISQNTAYPDRIFTADITVNRSIIRDKFLPISLSSTDVLCAGEPIGYSYKASSDHFSAHIAIPGENIKGNITINIPLVTPTETFPIILKANGGKFEDGFTMKAFDVLPGSTLSDLAGYNRPSQFREGYHFTHWELESDREQKLYEDEVIPLAPEGAIYVANCELNEIKMHIDPNGGAFPGMQINEVLDLNTVYDTTINQIPAYPGEPTKEGHKFLYYTDDTNKQFYPTSTVTIPDELDDNFCLKAVYAESLTITLNSNGGVFPPGAQTTFNTHKGITLSELEGYMEPTNGNLDFTHWECNGQEYQKNTVLDLSGNIVLIAKYAECEHTSFSGHTVANNQLYGICESCGAQVLIDDSKLSSFNNQFLYSNDTEYVLDSIVNLPTVVSGVTGKSLDIYLINGEYDLECSRPSLETLVKVNVYGLLNNSGELNAAVDCTNVQEGYPRFYLNIDFVFNNLIMKG